MVGNGRFNAICDVFEQFGGYAHLLLDDVDDERVINGSFKAVVYVRFRAYAGLEACAYFEYVAHFLFLVHNAVECVYTQGINLDCCFHGANIVYVVFGYKKNRDKFTILQ